MGKYAQYFIGNEILLIPEIVQQFEPRILSLVISDQKTKRLVGLPTEEQAVKAAASNIITKHFRLQPEYKGTRRICVTVCNVPAYITGEVLASYLSAFGKVEEINGDYTFRLCLTRDGFKAIPETLVSGDRQMMVVVEGRRPRCWGIKKLVISPSFAPQKTKKTRTLKPQQPQQPQRPPPPSASRRKYRARVRSSPRRMIMKAGPK